MLGIRVIILTILFLFKGYMVFGLTSDDPNNPSLCKVYYNATKTFYVSYRYTYWHYGFFTNERRSSVNYQMKKSIEWTLIHTCCDGYQPNRHNILLAECIPVCPSGCENGKCHLPNVCTCNLNYDASINQSNKYSHCLPHCLNGCRGGKCIAPETCICESGYLLNNDLGSCEPNCYYIVNGGLQGCGVNASCIAPGKCQCDDGYVAVDVSSDSTSSSSNDYQTTVTSDIDVTTLSYHVDKSTFTNSGIVCTPICKPECGKNANCVAPNECQCVNGYQQDSVSDHQTDRSECRPVCEETCINGFCSYPDECTCLSGYKPHRIDKYTCEPICQDDCINGKCTLPNYCECTDGYEKLSSAKEGDSENICIPICPGQRLNRHCVAPGIWLCNPGYVMTLPQKNRTTTDVTSDRSSSNDTDNYVSEQICQPLCEPTCSNESQCIAPNQCQLRVNISKDCGKNAIFSNLNDSCVCRFGWAGLNCTEHSVCSVVLSDDADVQFTNLKRIIFLDNETIESNYDNESLKTKKALDWDGPMCNDECRILMMSSITPESISDDSTNCYLFDLLNATIGLLSSRFLPPISQREDQNLICFVNVASMCNTIQSETKVGINGGAIGAAVLLAFVVALSLGIYLSRRQKCNFRESQVISKHNLMLTESEAAECMFRTEENVYH